jgi:hypothetical protein
VAAVALAGFVQEQAYPLQREQTTQLLLVVVVMVLQQKQGHQAALILYLAQ